MLCGPSLQPASIYNTLFLPGLTGSVQFNGQLPNTEVLALDYDCYQPGARYPVELQRNVRLGTLGNILGSRSQNCQLFTHSRRNLNTANEIAVVLIFSPRDHDNGRA